MRTTMSRNKRVLRALQQLEGEGQGDGSPCGRQFYVRLSRIAILGALLFASLSPGHASPGTEGGPASWAPTALPKVLRARTEAAIRKGEQWLRQQGSGARWWMEDVGVESRRLGVVALAAMALCEPELLLRPTPSYPQDFWSPRLLHVYDAGPALACLSCALRKDRLPPDQRAIGLDRGRVLRDYLEMAFRAGDRGAAGGWGYAPGSRCDLSNTEIAIWGLESAARIGLPSARSLWMSAGSEVLRARKEIKYAILDQGRRFLGAMT